MWILRPYLPRVVACLLVAPAVVLAAPGATPHSFEIGGVTGDARLTAFHVELISDRTGVHATWTLEVSTVSAEPVGLVIPIKVSHGLSITGLQVSIEGHPEYRARLLAHDEAWRSYAVFVRGGIDPALLELVERRLDHDLLELRVFPIANGRPGTIVIESWVPGGRWLTVAAKPTSTQVGVILDGRAIPPPYRSERTIEVPIAGSRAASRSHVPTYVTEMTSLLAGPPVRGEEPVAAVADEVRRRTLPMTDQSDAPSLAAR